MPPGSGLFDEVNAFAAGTPAAALLTPVGAVLALGLQQVIIQAVGEARPYALEPNALILIVKTTAPSFTSDHACVAGAVAAGLFFVNRKLGWVATVTALLMAFARVSVGAQWPLDVVVGLIFGAAVTYLVIVMLRHPAVRQLDWVKETAHRPLLAVGPAHG